MLKRTSLRGILARADFHSSSLHPGHDIICKNLAKFTLLKKSFKVKGTKTNSTLISQERVDDQDSTVDGEMGKRSGGHTKGRFALGGRGRLLKGRARCGSDDGLTVLMV